MSSGLVTHDATTARTSRLRAGLLAWVAMAGVDFLLQGGILAPLFDWQSPFLVEPAMAFARIPLAYVGLGLAATVLVWLLPKTGARDARSGIAVAVGLGGGLWTAFLVGLASISTANVTLLLGWWLAGVAEFAAGGWVIGAVTAGRRTRPIAIAVVAFAATCAVATVILQTVGYATSR